MSTPSLVDDAIKLKAQDAEFVTCPAVFFRVGECSFVIIKTAELRYRCQFLYKDLEQKGTGIREYDELAECVLSLLRTQADYKSLRSGAFPGGVKAPAQRPAGGDDD